MRTIKVSGHFECNDGTVLHDWALGGIGLAWPMWEVERDLAEGRLVSVLDNYAAPPTGIYAVFPQNPPAAALRVRLLIDHLRGYFRPAGLLARGLIAGGGRITQFEFRLQPARHRPAEDFRRLEVPVADDLGVGVGGRARDRLAARHQIDGAVGANRQFELEDTDRRVGQERPDIGRDIGDEFGLAGEAGQGQIAGRDFGRCVGRAGGGCGVCGLIRRRLGMTGLGRGAGCRVGAGGVARRAAGLGGLASRATSGVDADPPLPLRSAPGRASRLTTSA